MLDFLTTSVILSLTSLSFNVSASNIPAIIIDIPSNVISSDFWFDVNSICIYHFIYYLINY